MAFIFSFFLRRCKIMSLEEKCFHKECAMSQRANEVRLGLGLEGTKGFELIGCYECDGFNKQCDKYTYF